MGIFFDMQTPEIEQLDREIKERKEKQIRELQEMEEERTRMAEFFVPGTTTSREDFQNPEDIYKAAKLEEIAIPRNSLDGVISDRIVNLTNLAILDLRVNQLRGVLPLDFGKLSKLKILYLPLNNFEGSLPPSLMNCTNLIQLSLGGNHLQGDISTLNFSKLSQLTKLDLLSNNLNGSLPMSLYSCKSLKAIRLGANDIEGQIEPEILSLKSLSFLSISYSRLRNITKAMNILMHSKSLTFLAFQFSYVADEESPADFGIADFDDGFQRLENLELSGWPIPSQLGNLPRLFNVDFSSNRIGKINHHPDFELPVLDTTDGLIGQPHVQVIFFLSTGDILGTQQPAYMEVYLLKSANWIVSVAWGLSTTTSPAGNIPRQISNLKDLNYLDLSENHLSGQISSSLTSLINFLSFFNVSYNNLEGRIPTGTQIQGFDVSAFEGNAKVCGFPLPNECHSVKGFDDQDMDDEHKIPSFYFYIPGAGIGFIVGFWGVTGSLIFKKTWRYAYFRFLDKVQDMFCVLIVLRINKMKRRVNAS
ncbi:receptor-like protein 3 [Rosa rugosa]|uniref:receptor-like protein 3 n=1 Tax=Rosa rugosa TaxID=74645 RepID=UPI002B40EE29|nr:receptor-like protein 3 [Rosa rugosa]